jgi:hypothetical protein
LRTKQAILKKVEHWKLYPMMVTGIYRLFTYLPFEDIPKEYKEFFPEDAKDSWADDLKNFGREEIETELIVEMRALLQILAKRNIINALGVVPMLFADMYMANYGVSSFQGKLLKITKTFQEVVNVDRSLAEQLAMQEIIELLKEIIKKMNLKVPFDMDKVLEQMVESYDRAYKKAGIAMAQAQARAFNQAKDSSDTLDYDKIIEEAEAKELEMSKTKGVDVKGGL